MKLERLMAITILLLNRKRVQAQELSDRMEVSLRTIYRDLESLSLAGIPIISYTGTEGGYEIMENFRLDKQMLTLDELIALFTALRGLKSTQALNQSNMDRLLDKVGALISQAEHGRIADSDHIQIDFTPWRNNEAERNKYELLRKATEDKNLTRFSYTDIQGEETERSVEPMGLVLKGYAWYLHGYCLNREDYRTFKLTRLRNLEILADSFHRRDRTHVKLNAQWQPSRNQQFINLVLRFSHAAKVSVVDQFDESVIDRQLDGTLLVRTRLPDEKWLIPFLLQFKTDLVVLEPAHIAVEIREIALGIAALYEERSV